MAKWTLGRWGPLLNAIALVYTFFICFVLMMPPNQLAAKTLAGVLAALILIYVFEVRRKYVAPGWVSEHWADLAAGDSQALKSTRD